MLYCNQDPKQIGIENDQGNFNLKPFYEHIKTCDPCKRFLVILPAEIFRDLDLITRPREESGIDHNPAAGKNVTR